MDRHDLTDHEWNAIRRFLPKERTGGPGRPWLSHREVVNGILWVLAVGAPWRDLPPQYGNWSTVYKRFRRWQKIGLWDRIFAASLRRYEREYGIDRSLWCVDGSVVRAHRSSAGACSTSDEEPEDHALGRSQGGFSTKVHLLTDGLGIPLAVTLTAGQSHESKSLMHLLESVPDRIIKRPEALAGDKAYDSEWLREALRKKRIVDVIPRRKHKRKRERFHPAKYRRRNVVERVFGWLKEQRRIATRYDKLAANYLAFMKIAATRLLLKWL